MTEQEIVCKNFRFLMRKTTKGTNTEAFYVLLEEASRKNPNLVPHRSKGALDNLNKPDGTSRPGTVDDLAKWCNYFLHRTDVTYEDVTTRDISKSGVVTWDQYQLVGDYIGVYLDPTGAGDVKGLFLRLREDEEGVLWAHAIHNLSSADLMEKNLINSDDTESVFQSIGRRGSKIFKGLVDGDGDTVTIEVTHRSSRHKIILILDVSNYVKYVSEDMDKNRRYLGGLGLQIVTNDIRVSSPYATRVGVIRTEQITRKMLHNEQIKDFLAVSPHITQWGPLRLSLDWDRLWYEWFMAQSSDGSKTEVTE